METSSQIESSTNAAIFSRNVAGKKGPEVWYDPRPVSTKYATMPIVDPVRLGAKNAANPPNRYAQSINEESVLQNRMFALQRCDQAVYVPSSKSSLYDQRPTPSTSVARKLEAAAHGEHHQLFNNDTRSQRNA